MSMPPNDYNHIAVPLNESLSNWLSQHVTAVNQVANELGINPLFVAVGPLQEGTGTIFDQPVVIQGGPVLNSSGQIVYEPSENLKDSFLDTVVLTKTESQLEASYADSQPFVDLGH